jgi:membrane AbrB-like protein
MIANLVGVAVLKLWAGVSWDVPGPGRWVVYCVVGWLLGQTITREALGTLRTSAGVILVTVVLFLLFGLALAWAFHRLTDFDAHTALLTTAPGGIAQMGVLSAEAKADVLVENYRPGLLTRLGLDPADLREENPRLVTLSISGFGSGGPDGHRPGFDRSCRPRRG